MFCCQKLKPKNKKSFPRLENSRKRAFTLVELLVIIAIVGLLSAWAVVAVHAALVKGRDTRRAMNLKTMTLALELYLSTEGSYPVVVDTNGISSNQGLSLIHI